MQNQLTSSQVKLTLFEDNYQLRKYKIFEILNSLPKNHESQIKKSIISDLGITRQTLSNWLNASIYDNIEIPTQSFLRIAITLNVSPFELMNIPIKPIRVINTKMEKYRSIAQKTGLKY